jgi:DNA-directed RNA polymerase subunit omega
MVVLFLAFPGEERSAANQILHLSTRERDCMKLIEGFDSNYRYILVAARRARQLQSGAPPVVQTNSRKPCRIAQDEIRAGKVKWEIPETRSAAEQASETLDQAFGHEA